MVEIRSLRAIRPEGFTIALPQRPARPKPDPRVSGPHRKVWVRRLKDYPPGTPLDTPCVIWQGPLDKHGYGAMKRWSPLGIKQSVKVHRWVMELALGRLLDPAETVLHRCDNPPCFRVDHLRIGTIAENNADMVAKGRNVPPPRNRLFGTANPRSKITSRQRVEIYQRWLLGEDQDDLAAEFGVTPQYLNNLLRHFRDAPWAWQGMHAHLVAQGHKPRPMLVRLGVDEWRTKWQLFEARDLWAEADAFVAEMAEWNRDAAVRRMRRTQRTNDVKEDQ